MPEQRATIRRVLTSTVPRFSSSALIWRRRPFRPSTSRRRRRASVPVTRQPTSANACAASMLALFKGLCHPCWPQR